MSHGAPSLFFQVTYLGDPDANDTPDLPEPIRCPDCKKEIKPNKKTGRVICRSCGVEIKDLDATSILYDPEIKLFLKDL